MTSAQALARARKLWGAKGMVSDNKQRSTQHQRDVASKKLQEYKEQEPKFTPLEEWPGETTISEYRRAKSRYEREWKHWRRERDELSGAAHYYRYSVGEDVGFAFVVHGSGDTWEAAFAQAVKRGAVRTRASAQRN